MKNDNYDYYLEVGRRIRTSRLAAGLSQDELARRIGYSGRSAVSKLESGIIAPDLILIDKLSSVLDVTRNWLMYGEEGSEPSTYIDVTTEEIIVIEKFGMLNPSMQNRLKAYMDKLLELQQMEEDAETPQPDRFRTPDGKINLQ